MKGNAAKEMFLYIALTEIMIKEGAQEYVALFIDALNTSGTVGAVQQKWFVAAKMLELLLILAKLMLKYTWSSLGALRPVVLKLPW